MPPTVILGLLTVGFAFLKIHDIPLLNYILLVIEFSQNQQKRVWMPLGSIIKKLTLPLSTSKKKQTTKEKVAEKTIMSLSQLTKALDHNAFEHIENKSKDDIDAVSDKFLLQKTFLGKSEKEMQAHHARIDKIAQEDKKNIPKHQLEKGKLEA